MFYYPGFWSVHGDVAVRTIIGKYQGKWVEWWWSHQTASAMGIHVVTNLNVVVVNWKLVWEGSDHYPSAWLQDHKAQRGGRAPCIKNLSSRKCWDLGGVVMSPLSLPSLPAVGRRAILGWPAEDCGLAGVMEEEGAWSLFSNRTAHQPRIALHMGLTPHSFPWSCAGGWHNWRKRVAPPSSPTALLLPD